MARTKISKAAKDFNVSIATVVEFLQKKGITVDDNPNTRIDENAYDLLVKEYEPDRYLKSQSDRIASDRVRDKDKEKAKAAPEPEEIKIETRPAPGPKVIGKIDLEANKTAEVKETPAKVEVPAPTVE